MSVKYTGWDSNPRPSECESSPITTRPGLPSKVGILISSVHNAVFHAVSCCVSRQQNAICIMKRARMNATLNT